MRSASWCLSPKQESGSAGFPDETRPRRSRARRLEGIYHWIAPEGPRAARRVVDRIFASTELLASFPYMGRAGREEGTREWVVPRLPYIVVYEVHEVSGEVIVVAVFHGAQDWEAQLKERRGPTA